MSEKRFQIYQDSIRKFESNNIWGVKSETNSLEPYMTFEEAEKCCDLLNEQQSKITELEIELTDCKNRKEQSEYNLRRENEQLKQELVELLAVHTKIVETLDSEFVSKALEDGD